MVSVRDAEKVNLDTYNVLAGVRLILVALDSLRLAILALDDILVVTLLAKAVPLLAIVVANGPLLRPSILLSHHHEVHNFT